VRKRPKKDIAAKTGKFQLARGTKFSVRDFQIQSKKEKETLRNQKGEGKPCPPEEGKISIRYILKRFEKLRASRYNVCVHCLKCNAQRRKNSLGTGPRRG